MRKGFHLSSPPQALALSLSLHRHPYLHIPSTSPTQTPTLSTSKNTSRFLLLSPVLPLHLQKALSEACFLLTKKLISTKRLTPLLSAIRGYHKYFTRKGAQCRGHPDSEIAGTSSHEGFQKFFVLAVLSENRYV